MSDTAMSEGKDTAAAPARLVLLVDDEDSVLRSLRRYLVREGFQVETAPSADVAIEMLDAGLSPQVVMTDFRMPGMDGVAFLRLVKERWPAMQRVLMTGFADMHVIEAAINESAIYRFLAKPWDDAGLVATVRSAMEQWELETENARMGGLIREQNRQLAESNRDLEEKVQERTKVITRAKKEWEVAFDALSDPLMIIDRNFTILRANLALSTHFGRDIRTLTGQVCHELRAASEQKLPREADGICQGCPVERSRQSGVSSPFEFQTAARRVYSLAAYPIAGDERGATVCMYHDLTEQHSMSRQLAQADKLSAMGMMAGGVAHEINNPLGAILAFAQLLRRETLEPNEAAEYLQEIEESAVRCKQIVERLLRFARQAQSDEKRVFCLNDIVAETAFLVEKSYLPAGIRFQRELAPDLWSVQGNANEVSQVILNLITNARDAMAQGGALSVTTRNRPDEEAVEIAVRDTGHGIPPDVLARIFDPFFTTKPEGKGTGLGLAVSYGIVRDHHGQITVHSTLGEGTEFRVVLPRAQVASASGEEDQE
jgi:signal transduction histidine kinase